MAFCTKCGASLSGDTKFCASCGTPVSGQTNANQNTGNQQSGGNDFFSNMNKTADYSAQFDPNDVANNKGMALLSYLGLLVLIPWFAAPQSRYARFHAIQGFNLLALQIAYSIISFLLGLIKVPYTFYGYAYAYVTPWYIGVLLFIIGIPVLVLTVIGIINAVQGKAKQLPIIGKYNFFKLK